MKKLPLCLIFILCLIQYPDANAQLYNPAKPHLLEPAYFKRHQPETDSTTTDTVIRHINIDGDMFSLTVLRNKYERDGSFVDSDYYYESPVRLIFTREYDGKVLLNFKNGSNDYTIRKIQRRHLSDTGKFFLSITDFNGGPYLGGNMYLVTYTNVGGIKLDSVLHYNELSFCAFSKTGNDIINFYVPGSGCDEPGHYDNHRYVVSRHIFKNGVYKTIKLGKTKRKHTSSADGVNFSNIMKEIWSGEPQMFKTLKRSNYTFISVPF